MVETSENGVTIRAIYPLEYYKNGNNIHELNGIRYRVITNDIEELRELIENEADVSELVTTFVEYFTDAFYCVQTIHGTVCGWDVSNARSLCGMFAKAHMFNDDISYWNTQNVKTMHEMFHQAYSFNQNISRWNTSNVENMSLMFKDAYSFNCDLSGWDIRNVRTFFRMFHNAKRYSYDVMWSWSSNLMSRSCVSQLYVGSCIGYHKRRRNPTIVTTRCYWAELLARTWHPSRVEDWCFDIDMK